MRSLCFVPPCFTLGLNPGRSSDEHKNGFSVKLHLVEVREEVVVN